MQLVSLSTLLAQDSTAAATDQDGDGPEPPSHVKKRLTKKLHFLERVADSKRQALSATAGIRKKAHKSKHKQQKPLPDLSSLADLLAEVGQKQHQQAAEAGQGADGQPNKQKGRTEQINGSKARRAVTYVASFFAMLSRCMGQAASLKLAPHKDTMPALDVLLWHLQSFTMYALCMWHAVTASACTRLSLGRIHVLSFLPLANAGATTQLLVHVFDKLAVMGWFKYACLV